MRPVLQATTWDSGRSQKVPSSVVLFWEPHCNSGTQARLLMLWILCPGSLSPVEWLKQTLHQNIYQQTHPQWDYPHRTKDQHHDTFLFSHRATAPLHLWNESTKETWIAKKITSSRKIMKGTRKYNRNNKNLPWIRVSRRVFKAALSLITVSGSKSCGFVNEACTLF